MLQVLEQASKAGIAIWCEGELLHYRAPDTPEAAALLEELRQHKAEVLAALGPGVPVIRFTLRETEDVEGDVAFLRRIVDTLREYPGGNRIICTIRGLPTCPHEDHPLLECGQRCKHVVEWRALATPQLRRRLADLLRQRAVSQSQPETVRK